MSKNREKCQRTDATYTQPRAFSAQLIERVDLVGSSDEVCIIIIIIIKLVPNSLIVTSIFKWIIIGSIHGIVAKRRSHENWLILSKQKINLTYYVCCVPK